MSGKELDVNMNRRSNLLQLIGDYVSDATARGEAAFGIEKRFAELMEISNVSLSQFKSSRNIGDRVARQIESKAGKPVGWLDEDHGTHIATDSEQAFLELARQAWRGTDAKGRRELMKKAKAGFLP